MKSLLWAAIVVGFVPFFVFGQSDSNPARGDVIRSLDEIVNFNAMLKELPYRERGQLPAFSSAQEEKLLANGFVVIPDRCQQFFHVYESSHYGESPRIANFITSDCILHIYHMFYDFTLRVAEAEYLFPAVRDLTIAALEESKSYYVQIHDSSLREAARKNVEYFGVAAALISEADTTLSPEIQSVIAGELGKIEAHAERTRSGIFPFEQDYTQFNPRGHYDRSPELQQYFRVMMWYGRSPFPFRYNDSKTEEQIRQALLITRMMFIQREDSVRLIDLWDAIYSITDHYVGSSNALTPYQFRNLMDEAYGTDATLEDFADAKGLNKLYRLVDKHPLPRIQAQAAGIPDGLQFRMMGQRFMPDTYIMQKLISFGHRPWPSGLDVMAVLGSDRAATILDDSLKQPQLWDEYLPRRAKLVEEFSKLDSADWNRNLYSGWLHLLTNLWKEKHEGFPAFMRNPAWTDKQLTTALASWAEARHDVILYAEQSWAEGGDGHEEVEQPKGYVEPTPGLYTELASLVTKTEDVLESSGYLDNDMRDICGSYRNLLDFLTSVSRKELAADDLTYDEYERIRKIGAEMETLLISIIGLERNVPVYNQGKPTDQKRDRLRGWFEVTGPDRDIAIIADVHTTLDSCLEVAVGHIDRIFVIVPINGKPHLTRGGVFSFYEFHYHASGRLDDRAWQEMLWRALEPPRPIWTSTYCTDDWSYDPRQRRERITK
ncbi:DUF3160 domain-containing protein [candidate division KSB1 bacterium]|nr:MAG: DUF3160 domain-containing protein [candidate division KSB1 bacterium]